MFNLSETRDRLFFGSALIVLGILFLLDGFEFLRFDRWWPLILIWIGVWHWSAKRLGSAIIFVALGAFFLANELGFIYWAESWQFWPLLLIAIGVWFLVRPRLTSVPHIPLLESNDLNIVALFGGGNRVVTSQSFRGGQAGVIFGGININLEQAKLAPGKIPLTLLAILGGFDIIVPEEWNVEVRGIPIFAGMKVTRPLRPFHLLRESEVHM